MGTIFLLCPHEIDGKEGESGATEREFGRIAEFTSSCPNVARRPQVLFGRAEAGRTVAIVDSIWAVLISCASRITPVHHVGLHSGREFRHAGGPSEQRTAHAKFVVKCNPSPIGQGLTLLSQIVIMILTKTTETFLRPTVFSSFELRAWFPIMYKTHIHDNDES